MLLAKSVPTLGEVDGRLFVDTDAFLACYEPVSSIITARFKDTLKESGAMVEKRVEESFYERLNAWCVQANYPFPALYSPIVMSDGWVI